MAADVIRFGSDPFRDALLEQIGELLGRRQTESVEVLKERRIVPDHSRLPPILPFDGLDDIDFGGIGRHTIGFHRTKSRNLVRWGKQTAENLLELSCELCHGSPLPNIVIELDDVVHADVVRAGFGITNG